MGGREGRRMDLQVGLENVWGGRMGGILFNLVHSVNKSSAPQDRSTTQLLSSTVHA